MAVLESKLIIGASDETGAAFASVMARITELSAKLAAVQLAGSRRRRLSRASRATMAATAAVAPFAGYAGRLDSVASALRAAPPAVGGFWETAGAAIATFTGAKAVMGGYHEAMEQQHERMRQELAAMSADEIAKGEKLSAELAAKYPSIPQSEVMHSLRTARTVTGSFDEATDVLEPLTKLRVIAQAASPGTSAEDMREEFDKLVKALGSGRRRPGQAAAQFVHQRRCQIAQRLRRPDQARRLLRHAALWAPGEFADLRTLPDDDPGHSGI